MAQKRMFSLSVIDTDEFIEMPMSARLLYYELGMRADDDGFVPNWKKILLFTGTKEDDMKILITKSFIIPFESGVIVIRHWRLNNYLQKDRYKETIYKQEMALLSQDQNGVYSLDTGCIQDVYSLDTQYSIDKNSIDKNSINKNANKFIKPTVEDISNYCIERKNDIDPNNFYDFYESKGWKVGKNQMKDWKACIRTWEKNKNKNEKLNNQYQNNQYTNLERFYIN